MSSGLTYNNAHAHDIFLREITVRLVGNIVVACCADAIASGMSFDGMVTVVALAVEVIAVDDVVVETVEVAASVAVIDRARVGRTPEKWQKGADVEIPVPYEAGSAS
jgi:hypothetical protein